jgi:hypothetical protein
VKALQPFIKEAGKEKLESKSKAKLAKDGKVGILMLCDLWVFLNVFFVLIARLVRVDSLWCLPTQARACPVNRLQLRIGALF